MSSLLNGMDTVLTRRGKQLKTGESTRITLVKGPTFVGQADPVSKNKPPESFPLVLEFSESVVRPNFNKEWNSSRLYQQDVPKAQLDSDEEALEASLLVKRRRRKKDAPQRQWVLQEKREFVNYMITKKRNKVWDTNAASTRYEGTNESNPSHYVVLSVSNNQERIQVQTMPTNGVVSIPLLGLRSVYACAANATLVSSNCGDPLCGKCADEGQASSSLHAPVWTMPR